MKTRILLFILIIMQTAAQASVVTLSNDAVEVGIAPEVGGRVVFIRKPGGVNMLLSDKAIYEDLAFVAPEVGDKPDFYPFNGITLWLGPQSGWWKDQTFAPELDGKSPGWPPDPFGEHGRFEILTQRDDYIEMHGPKSPVSGLQFVKTVQIMPCGTIKLEFTATNYRETPVEWGLWVNIRTTPHAKASVKLKSMADVRFSENEDESRDPLSTEFKDGVFSLLPVMPSEGKAVRGGKVFIKDPETPEIVAEYKGTKMTIQFDRVAPEEIHPEQTPIELYSHLSAVPDPALELLELEFHGPYGVFNPSESKSIACTIKLD